MFGLFRNLHFFNSQEYRDLIMNNFISEPNKHIEEYIDYYCEDRLNNYAVLINGKWGVGKTWFISKVEERLKEKNKNVIYISLNGVAKKEAIDDEILRFLHPFWTNKKVKFLGRVASGLVKATLKVDLNNDGQSETLNVAVPSVNLDELLTKGENLILIFDDVERCQIPISEILGYINYFVEHTKSKVILIGNEEEILKKDEKYLSEKEKIIGTTFLFNGDVNNAFDSMINDFLSENFKTKIIKNKSLILDVYTASKHQNIRVLKQSLHEFQRLFNIISWKDNEELFEKILRNFLILSIEYKKHSFSNKLFLFKNDEIEKDFYSRYNLSKYSSYILDILIWNDIVVNNILNKEMIESNLNLNYFNYQAEKPDWYKLWHYYDLSNYDFINILESAVKKLNNFEYNNFGEVLHVVSAVIYFNHNFVTGFDSNETKIKGFNNISHICKNLNRSELDQYIKFTDKTNWGGYSFLGYDLVSVKNFINEFVSKIEEEKNSRIKEEAKDLMELLKKDHILFLHKICLTNSSENVYYNVPILKEIPPEDFSEFIVKSDWDTVKMVLSALNKRYDLDAKTINDILVEKEWLETVLNHLIYIANQRNSIEKYKIESWPIRNIKKILDSFPEEAV
ncbi:P-loop NTPase fold protein [Acinetobacter baumannii]|uniref:P-loop NTPase fold protein n=1 Tax=Acinetobacter baumannii TaxID=470 RepID=UPI002448F502|nr:P-loop NTPase fold protein [Acinetobacter baumannii]MDH2497933.1 P-loop NTPase fold protein [Acinetobacter baumannii]MDV7473253.1 P-loop NTPase fold protein [Acinetobacter baumannii]